jgi:methyl-accepting chemotaxis protein
MNMLKKSLGAKILVLVSVLTATVFSALFVVNSYWQRNDTMNQIDRMGVRVTDLLQMAIEGPMMVGDDKGTHQQFGKVADLYSDVTIHLTDFRGNVTYSTRPEVVREDASELLVRPDARKLLADGLNQDIDHGMLLQETDTASYARVRSIANGPECHHCHGASQPILGAMLVFQDVTPEMATLQDHQLKGGALSLGGFSFMLLGLLLFMKKAVVQKIAALDKASQEISQGDYSVQFTVSGSDELARLAGNLGTMVHEIENQLEYNKGVLEGIAVPLYVTDAEERIQYINDQALDLLGKTRKNVQSETASSVFLGEQTGSAASEVLRNGNLIKGARVYKRPDGRQVSVHREVSPLRNAHGQIVGAIGVLVDQTQQEQSKQRIQAQQDNLVAVAGEVSRMADSLAGVAKNLSTKMDAVTKGIGHTEAQTGQAATAMNQMASTVTEVAQNASQTATAADEANKNAVQGGAGIRATVDEVKHVARNATELGQSLNALSGRVQDIVQVLGVINDIADQTNLLALNAAIEAARAGDAGRGFAVVADEVRKLAERTMQATRQVEDVIATIQGSTQDAVAKMEQTRSIVDATAQKASGAGEALQGIVAQSESIADMVRGIATAAEEQSVTSDEINESISQINKLSISNGEEIREADKAIHEIARMAEKLTELVHKLQQADHQGQ